MMGRVLAWGLLAAVAGAIPAARAATGADSMVVVESREIQQGMFGERSEATVTASTWGDRRSEETDARIIPPQGAPVRRRERSIVALDRGLIWTILPADTSYSEVTLDEARSLVAAVPKPTKSGEKELGAGGRVAGFATRRFELRFRGPRLSETPSAVDSAEYIHEVWIAQGVPGHDRLLAFERRDMGQLSALDAAAAELAARSGGRVLKTVTRLHFPPSMRAMLAAIADSVARAMSLDPKQGSMVVHRAEVVSVRVVPARRDRFELPRGLKKKPAQQQEMLELLKQSQGKTPGR